jgi:TonB family protein
MERERNSSDQDSGQNRLADLLKSRVQAFQQGQGTEAGGTSPGVCRECGSPLSETSAFCFMCGAARDKGAAATGPVLMAKNPVQVPDTAVPGTAQTSRVTSFPGFTAPQVTGASSTTPITTATAPAYEPSATPDQPAQDPALFEHFYPQSDLEPVEEEERRAKFDYKLLLIPLLLAAILVLGYRQREKTRGMYSMLKQSISGEVAQYLPALRPATTQRATQPAAPRSHTRLRTSVVRRGTPVKSSDWVGTRFRYGTEGYKPSLMRVRVEGQPRPDLISTAGTMAEPFMGDTGGPEVTTGPQRIPFAISISPRESLALLLKQIPPVYPPAARAANVQGPVVLKAMIRKDGLVGDLSILSGDPLLTQAAIDAVRQWVYRPYYRNGQPTEVETLVVVDFSLADADRAEHRTKKHPGA